MNGSWYLLQFILGGGVIVGMSWLAEHIHTKYSAFLYVIPAQLTAAAIFTYVGTSTATVQSLMLETLASLLILVAFILTFYYSLNHVGFWSSMIISYAVFAVATTLYFTFI